MCPRRNLNTCPFSGWNVDLNILTFERKGGQGIFDPLLQVILGYYGARNSLSIFTLGVSKYAYTESGPQNHEWGGCMVLLLTPTDMDILHICVSDSVGGHPIPHAGTPGRRCIPQWLIPLKPTALSFWGSLEHGTG